MCGGKGGNVWQKKGGMCGRRGNVWQKGGMCGGKRECVAERGNVWQKGEMCGRRGECVAEGENVWQKRECVVEGGNVWQKGGKGWQKGENVAEGGNGWRKSECVVEGGNVWRKGRMCGGKGKWPFEEKIFRKRKIGLFKIRFFLILEECPSVRFSLINLLPTYEPCHSHLIKMTKVQLMSFVLIMKQCKRMKTFRWGSNPHLNTCQVLYRQTAVCQAFLLYPCIQYTQI